MNFKSQSLLNPKSGNVFPTVQTCAWHGSANNFLIGQFGYCAILIEYDEL